MYIGFALNAPGGKEFRIFIAAVMFEIFTRSSKSAIFALIDFTLWRKKLRRRPWENCTCSNGVFTNGSDICLSFL